jgi:hypothetical protein
MKNFVLLTFLLLVGCECGPTPTYRTSLGLVEYYNSELAHAYDVGVRANKSGIEAKANPYIGEILRTPPGQPDLPAGRAEAWLNGWMDAKNETDLQK